MIVFIFITQFLNKFKICIILIFFNIILWQNSFKNKNHILYLLTRYLDSLQKNLLNKARTLATFSREMNCIKILVSI